MYVVPEADAIYFGSRCKICIFMGKTDPTAAKHQQQTMILVRKLERFLLYSKLLPHSKSATVWD